ncbi:autotransporter domain-containing protein [Ahrensia sp. R2A130]|uniref:autotransporter domain-containing protein n=1 Tax=Ahrensia sp. R2A130 TaxID=744979 RepID=UPI0001E0D134|nr:autotransporter domain-containing protein [Ahrensia sp. R2A130]EFL87910.1 putative outer membrane autotransporter barrel domain protein [Ahrensia sp. R2A130]
MSKISRVAFTLATAVSAAAMSAAMTSYASAQTFTSADTPLRIPASGSAGTIVTTINVASMGIISDLNVSLDATHSFSADLDIELTSPNGTIVTLARDDGSNGDWAGVYTFDDQAAVSFTAAVSDAGNNVVVGSYQTDSDDTQVLADFNGEEAAGVWSLEIVDDAGSDFGQLNQWQLIFLFQLIADGDQSFLAGPVANAAADLSSMILGSLAERRSASFASLAAPAAGDDGTFGSTYGLTTDVSSANPYINGTGGMFLRVGGSAVKEDGNISGLTAATGFGEVDGTMGFIQAGVAGRLTDLASGHIVASLQAHYATGDYDIEDATGAKRGSFDLDGSGVGISMTYIGNEGLVADLALQTTFYDARVKTATGATGTTDMHSFSVSGELGKEFALSNGWSLLPHVQLSAVHVDIDDFTDSSGTTVSYSNNTQVELQAGTAFIYRGVFDNGARYVADVKTQVAHTFDNDVDFAVAGVGQSFDSSGTDGIISAGFSVAQGTSPWSVGAKGQYRFALDGDDSQALSGSISLGYAF